MGRDELRPHDAIGPPRGFGTLQVLRPAKQAATQTRLAPWRRELSWARVVDHGFAVVERCRLAVPPDLNTLGRPEYHSTI